MTACNIQLGYSALRLTKENYLLVLFCVFCVGIRFFKESFFFLWRCDPTQVMASSFLRFLDHTLRTTVGRTPLDERSARRRDLYLPTHNTHNKQTPMPRRNSNPQSEQASGRRPLKPRGHWDRRGKNIG